MFDGEADGCRECAHRGGSPRAREGTSIWAVVVPLMRFPNGSLTQPMSARLYKQMEIGWVFVFVFVGAALNLLVAGATGRVYDFWSGRRGRGKTVADLMSPSARLALSCLGALFFVVAIFLALHLLGGWPHTSQLEPSLRDVP
jgi:hypothetical protein